MHENEYEIPGFPFYKITSNGNVYSYKRGKKILMTPSISNSGYLLVGLRKEGKRKHIFIHQLMAMTFLGHVPNGHENVVDHINENKLDNRIENLRLISNRENVSIGKHKKRNLPTGVSIHRIKGAYRDYIYFRAQIYLDKGTHLGLFKSPQAASEAYQQALINFEKNRTKTDV